MCAFNFRGCHGVGFAVLTGFSIEGDFKPTFWSLLRGREGGGEPSVILTSPLVSLNPADLRAVG
jgi:hypothetical protein